MVIIDHYSVDPEQLKFVLLPLCLQPPFFALLVSTEIVFALAVVEIILSQALVRGLHSFRTWKSIEKSVCVRVHSRGMAFWTTHLLRCKKKEFVSIYQVNCGICCKKYTQLFEKQLQF